MSKRPSKPSPKQRAIAARKRRRAQRAAGQPSRLVDENRGVAERGYGDNTAPHSPPPPHLASFAGTTHLEQGVRFLQSGDLPNAASCFERALQVNPSDAVAHNCLGIVDRLSGRHDAALERFRNALRLRPTFAEAHNNLGNTLRDLNRLSEAEVAYRQSIQLKPEFPEAHNNLGVILLAQDALPSAITCFQRALQWQPQYVEALNNLGNAQRLSGATNDACNSFSAALRYAPHSAEIHNNLGNALRDLGDLTAARAHYEFAAQCSPPLIEAHHNLGSVLTDLEDLSAAIEVYRRATTFSPDLATTSIYLGNVHRLRGETDEAQQAYQTAAAERPDDAMLELRLAALCPIIFPGMSAAEQFRQSSLLRWQELANRDWVRTSDLESLRLVEPPFELQFLPGNLKPHRQAFAGIYQDRFPQQSLPSRRSRPRIGIVVTRSHEGIFLKSMRGLIDRMPASLAEVVIACPSSSIEPLKSEIASPAAFMPLERQFHKVGQQLRDAAFDVLYYWEVGTDSLNYFLPFLRLAPVQTTGWGYQTTSGIPSIDYYFSSDYAEGPDAAGHYSETLLRSRTLLTFQDRIVHQPTAGCRERFNFPADAHIYLAAHQLGKFHPDFDPRLAGILRRDRQGLIVILKDRHDVAAPQLQDRFSRTMPDVEHRILFLPRLNRSDYLDLVSVSDVVLDPPHFSGANTTYDALTFGKPVITLPTDYRRGRFTAGCYRRMGITDFVVGNDQEYIDLAVTMATETDRRHDAFHALRDASDVLFEEELAALEWNRLLEELLQIAREHDS